MARRGAARGSGAPSKRRRWVAGLLLTGWAALGLAGCKGCKKDEEEATPPVTPPPGGASPEMVSTGLGVGLGLDSHAVPTSTRWQRVFVLDDKGAVVVGRSLDQAIALRTADGGRSWQALKAPAEGAASFWGIADDGTVALGLGQPVKGKGPADGAPLASLKLLFAEPQETELGGPIPIVPKGTAPAGATVSGGSGRPAVWQGAVGAVLLSTGGRQAAMTYAAPAGSKLPEQPTPMPAEPFVAAPYGRPPSLLSVRGGTVMVRPWPQPGEALEQAIPLPGLRTSAAATAQLSAGPDCESGPWSFRRVALGPRSSHVVGISPTRALSFPLPPGDTALLGCSSDAVVIKLADAKTGQPTLVRCTLDGQCAAPQSPPFRYWTGEHEHSIAATATAEGVVATMSAKAGARWGLYLGQSLDGGKLFELPRVAGEGTSDRGYLEVGAIVSLPKRVLLLISADVTGTSRRGWYVLASDDGGTNWGPP